MTELEALNNVAQGLGLEVHKKYEQDRRKTVDKYFVSMNGTSVSPVYYYEQMNCFLNGWARGTRFATLTPQQ